MKKYFIYLFSLSGVTLLSYLSIDYIFPLPIEKLESGYSQEILDRNKNILRCYLSNEDMWRLYTPLTSISPELIKTTLNFEDKWFYYHPGFNPISILTAIYQNTKYGKRIRGGSTITMQLAKLIEPKKRNIKNKLIELFRSFQLEWYYSKDEVIRQ